MKRIIFILTISVLLQGCVSNEQHIQELFNSDKRLLDEFIEVASQDRILRSNNNKLISFKRLSESTKNKIEKLGLGEVNYVVMESQECDAGSYSIEIIYNGNWHLEYKPCGFDYTVPRGHDEKGLIESWGLDDHWMLWVNNDYIG